ncbi:hypothetical protein [Sulfitobacter sp. JL08]|nr:hypothetical protein [Sulfitobacter sp. JL08]
MQRVVGTVEKLQVGMKVFQQVVPQIEDGAALSVTLFLDIPVQALS